VNRALSIEICSEQDVLQFDGELLCRAAREILTDSGVRSGSLSIAVVDDPTIHYPTDVLSFLLDRDGDRLEGEVIVSADTAMRTAAQLNWPAEHELLLYVIHGVLHLVGYDDLESELQQQMRKQERAYLARFGLTPPQM
jgi:probable rRNA maturation factor